MGHVKQKSAFEHALKRAGAQSNLGFALSAYAQRHIFALHSPHTRDRIHLVVVLAITDWKLID